MIKTYLEALLITLIRNQKTASSTIEAAAKIKQSSLQKEKAEQRIVQQILDYLKDNLSQSFTQDQLCRTFSLGEKPVEGAFPVTDANRRLRSVQITENRTSQNLYQRWRYNFTEIAAMLGYASIHYFSRDFKKTVGMSPSDYAKSVKARV